MAKKNNAPVNTPDEDILDPQDMYLSLDLDDGTELECKILSIFAVGEDDYIALAPLNEKEEMTEEVIFYRYYEDEEGNPSLDNIESDDEFDMVIDRFDELLDEEEFENA